MVHKLLCIKGANQANQKVSPKQTIKTIKTCSSCKVSPVPNQEWKPCHNCQCSECINAWLRVARLHSSHRHSWHWHGEPLLHYALCGTSSDDPSPAGEHCDWPPIPSRHQKCHIGWKKIQQPPWASEWKLPHRVEKAKPLRQINDQRPKMQTKDAWTFRLARLEHLRCDANVYSVPCQKNIRVQRVFQAPSSIRSFGLMHPHTPCNHVGQHLHSEVPGMHRQGPANMDEKRKQRPNLWAKWPVRLGDGTLVKGSNRSNMK